MICTDPETLREADKQFKRKINAAKHDIKDEQTGSWGTSCGHSQQRNLLINFQDGIDNEI